MKLSFYQFSLTELRNLFLDQGLHVSGADLLYHWHYKLKNISACEKDLAKKSIQFVQDYFEFHLPKINLVHESQDKTVKFLFELQDKLTIEAVLIPFNDKYTLCLSSQVGCGMNCSFCHTGEQGLKRNLQSSEIVGQFILAKRWLNEFRPQDNRLLNIVFMGQGEPLHNFDQVKKACNIFLEKKGLSIAPHKITISTAGYLPGLMRWKDEMPKVNIAVSLHSIQKNKRDELIPINKKFPFEKIVEIAETIPEGRTRFVTYEYLLIKNFNDSEEEAHELGAFLKNKNAYISLIPFNPYPGGKYQRPTDEDVISFKLILDTYKVPTLIRKTKGDSILAACGQLNSSLKGSQSEV